MSACSNLTSGAPQAAGLPAAPTPDPATAQLRAFWVDAFHPGIKSPQEVDQLVSDLQAAHANAVFVEVRKRGDAYYNSPLVPRSDDLSKLPDFDPLADLIAKAHAAVPRLEVHAWLVMLPVAARSDAPAAKNHLLYTHGPDAPESERWISVAMDGGLVAENNYFLDPGVPAAAQYLVDVVKDLVARYDVDGVHMDYIRYAGSQWGYHPLSLARYFAQSGKNEKPAPTDPAWQAWRREQVTALVRQVYLETVALKPRVKVSAATIAWGAGPSSDAQWQASRTMSDVLQDWNSWMQEGILDMAVPMNYDRDADANQHKWFDQWIAWEKDHAYGRQVVIGVAAYLNPFDSTLAQARRALEAAPSGARAQGVCFYSYAALDPYNTTPAKFFRALTEPAEDGTPAPFTLPALPPDMSWKTQPQTGALKGLGTLSGGLPADGASVLVQGPREERTLPVSGTGFFGAAVLAPGEYRLSLIVNGNTIATGQVKVEAGKVTEIHLGS